MSSASATQSAVPWCADITSAGIVTVAVHSDCVCCLCGRDGTSAGAAVPAYGAVSAAVRGHTGCCKGALLA